MNPTTLPPRLPRSQPQTAPSVARSRPAGPHHTPKPQIRPGQQARAGAQDKLHDRAGEAPLRGLDAMLQDGLGRADLPAPLDLVAALESAERFAPMADRAVPGLGRLVGAVIQDERHKLSRLLDLGGR